MSEALLNFLDVNDIGKLLQEGVNSPPEEVGLGFRRLGVASGAGTEKLLVATHPVGPPEVPKINYGAPHDEPPKDDPGTTSIKIRLPTGVVTVKRFRNSDLVKSLFAEVAKLCTENFDIVTSCPPLRSLSPQLSLTISEAGLNGSQVSVRIL